MAQGSGGWAVPCASRHPQGDPRPHACGSSTSDQGAAWLCTGAAVCAPGVEAAREPAVFDQRPRTSFLLPEEVLALVQGALEAANHIFICAGAGDSACDATRGRRLHQRFARFGPRWLPGVLCRPGVCLPAPPAPRAAMARCRPSKGRRRGQEGRHAQQQLPAQAPVRRGCVGNWHALRNECSTRNAPAHRLPAPPGGSTTLLITLALSRPRHQPLHWAPAAVAAADPAAGTSGS